MGEQRSPRVSMEEQVRLINECRRSGMTDADWCRSQGISPSTFYNWVSRCRSREAAKIPAPSYGHSDIPAEKQEVVPVNLVPDISESVAAATTPLSKNKNLDNPDKLIQTCAIEVKMQDYSVRVNNDADPVLLARTLQILRELSC